MVICDSGVIFADAFDGDVSFAVVEEFCVERGIGHYKEDDDSPGNG